MNATTFRLAVPLLVAVLLAAPAVAAEAGTEPGAGPGADPARLVAATRLAEDTGGIARISRVLDAMRGVMVRIIVSHGKDAAGAGRIVDEVLLPAMRARLPELHAVFVQFWADAMSTEQLDTADAFFRSPTGRRMVEVQTQSLPALVALGQAWGSRVGAEVLTSQRDALRQRGVSL